MDAIIPRRLIKKIAENSPNEKYRAFYSSIIVDTKEREFRAKRKKIQQDLKKGILPKNLDRVHTHRLTVYDNKMRWEYYKGKIYEDFAEKELSSDRIPKRLFTKDLEKIRHFFHDLLKRESFDNQNARIESFLKYGNNYVNAYFDGEYLVFGTGDNYYFNDFSKDYTVVAHELGHAVTQYESNLDYENQSGALNESMSDVFAICALQKKQNYDVNQSDWIIGPKVFTTKVNARGLRSFKNEPAYDDPVLGGKDDQPKFMSDYQNLPNDENGDYGGVHINSGIPNHAFYLFNQKLGGRTWDNGSLQIWYNTNLKSTGLPNNSTFKQFAQKTLEVADNLQKDTAKLEFAWKEVGIL